MRLSSFIASRFSRSLRSGFARFTTLVSVGSVALGCTALIVSMSVLRGYEEMIEETALRYTSHLELRRFDGGVIPEADVLQDRLRTVDHVERVDPLLVREALVRTRNGVEGAVLHGLTSARMPLLVPNGIQGGAGVGAEIARRLGVRVGDTLVLYASDGGGAAASPILFSARVDAVVQTGMQSIDESVIVMDLAQLQQALRLAPADVSHLAVELDDPTLARTIASQMAPEAGGLMLITWEDRFQAIASWIELQKQPIPIVLGLISLVAVFTLVSTLLVTVVEKTRSLAILLTIGMAPRQVMTIVALRGLRISAAGAAIGVVISVMFAMVQRTWQPITLDGTVYYVSALPVSIDPAPYLIVPLASIVLAVAASVVPMLAVRRVQPARALRFS